MTSLYVLVVDRAWAKLFKTGIPPSDLSLVYHQALFGAAAQENADEELARGLCRLLRADRQLGKYDRIVMLASGNMLQALRRQYDGDWQHVTVGRIEALPARYTDADVATQVKYLLTQREFHGGGMEMAPLLRK